MAPEGEAEDGRSSRVDYTVCFMARTARTQQGTVQKQRPLGQNVQSAASQQPEGRRPHISPPPPINPTTMSNPSIHPTTRTSTVKKCRFCHHRLRITQIYNTITTPKNPSRKTSSNNHITESST
jgi:hypothetical protein